MFVRRDLTDSVPTPSGNMHFVKKGSGYPVVLLHPPGHIHMDLGRGDRLHKPELHLLRL